MFLVFLWFFFVNIFCLKKKRRKCVVCVIHLCVCSWSQSPMNIKQFFSVVPKQKTFELVSMRILFMNAVYTIINNSKWFSIFYILLFENSFLFFLVCVCIFSIWDLSSRKTLMHIYIYHENYLCVWCTSINYSVQPDKIYNQTNGPWWWTPFNNDEI